ncbi:MAG: MlrC C-terminal domain-containing protein [Caldilineaceae bacterium]|nr:MlrC C-terminal domain-containing protein [Caldilineaceae bacterium]
MLRTFIEAGLDDACVLYIFDPEAAEQCHQAGVGATIPFFAGLESTLSPSAHIRQGGLHVIVTSGREQPLDTAFARTLGLARRRCAISR